MQCPVGPIAPKYLQSLIIISTQHLRQMLDVPNTNIPSGNYLCGNSDTTSHFSLFFFLCILVLGAQFERHKCPKNCWNCKWSLLIIGSYGPRDHHKDRPLQIKICLPTTAKLTCLYLLAWNRALLLVGRSYLIYELQRNHTNYLILVNYSTLIFIDSRVVTMTVYHITPKVDSSCWVWVEVLRPVGI